MAPSDKILESKLRSAVEEIFADEEQRDGLTVRLIRDKVESEQDLEIGFFKPRNGRIGARRSSRAGQAEEAPKKEETPSDVLEDEPSEVSSVESTASNFEDSDISDAPKRKRSSTSKTRTPVKRGDKKKKAVSSSEDNDISEGSSENEESDAASTPAKKSYPSKKGSKAAGGERQSKTSRIESDEESGDDTLQTEATAEDDTLQNEETTEDEMETPKKKSPVKNPTPKKHTPKKSTPKKPAFTKPDEGRQRTESRSNDSDSSEMSIVLDEPPKSKQKRRTKSEMASSTTSSKPAKSSKVSKVKKDSKPAKELNGAEADIKTLQSHLVKCGVRKIWGFELKQYGDDNKAKIRHLQGMLADIGMVGRFSGQRAKEIKELRELQADLEAVKEGDSKWGLDSGRRNRGQRKSFKEDSDDEEDEEGGSDGEGKATRSRSASEKPASKAAKLKSELAFLGSEEESDSD